MQASAVVPSTRGDGKRALILLIIGALLLVIGIVGLFSLQGKAVRFDKAYDEKGDLSPYFLDSSRRARAIRPCKTCGWVSAAIACG